MALRPFPHDATPSDIEKRIAEMALKALTERARTDPEAAKALAELRAKGTIPNA